MSAYCDTLRCYDFASNGQKCAQHAATEQKSNQVPHGIVLGTAHGIDSYHCTHEHLNHEQYDHLHYVRDARGHLRCSGDKWHAMEYARRWWITHLDVFLPTLPQPSDLWERNFVKRLSDGARVDVQFHEGGTAKASPRVHDLLLWQKTDGRPFGHVAVVVDVQDDHIKVAEQSTDEKKWQGREFSRELAIAKSADGAITIVDASDPVHGWVRVVHDKVLPPIPWKAPDDDRTAVDGDYGMGTVMTLQKFLGITDDGVHGRQTDAALAAFLNTHLPGYQHIPIRPEGKDMDRSHLIKKLQHFLLQHSLISGAGTEKTEIKETGEWDAATTRGVQNLINRVTHADEFKDAEAVYKAGGGPPPRPNLPHGVLLGEPKFGVNAFNCNYQNMVPPGADEPPLDMLTYVKDARGNLQYSGMKWQCVEYARRWWITHFDVTLLNVPRACDIWSRTYVKRLSDGKNVALEMLASGVSTDPPRVGDLIIWKKTSEQPVGHVAVVCEVTENSVRIGEQNVDNNVMWGGGHFSREFPLQRNETTGAFTLRDDEDPLFGWVRVHPDRVVDTPPWAAPETLAVPIDGVLSPETLTAWQKFVGVDVKRDLGDVDLTVPRWAGMVARMTDAASAAFLNVVHQQFPHVAMGSFFDYKRQPVVTKLQNFLNAYPELTGAGPEGCHIVENGEWEESTTRAVQNLVNKITHYEDFEAAVAFYRKK